MRKAIAARIPSRASLLKGVLLASTVLAASTAAQAQTQFTSLTAFGDSYIDHGVNLLPLLSRNTSNYPSHGASAATLLASSPLGYIAYPYPLQTELGLTNAQLTNYGIGGATTTQLNVVAGAGAISLPYELAAWGGKPFGPRDLVLINIGGNDALGGLQMGLPPAPFGAQVATNAVGAVEKFAQAGARNVVFTGFSTMSQLPVVQAAGLGGLTDQFAASYYATLQQQLRPLAQAGTRIFLVDQGLLGKQIAANPKAYGFDSIAYAGPGVKSMFVADGLHQSTEGFALGARYIANVLNAPSTFAAQGDVAQITATGFGRSIFSQLDGGRSAGFGMATMADLSMPTKAPPGANLAPVNPLSFYIGVTGATGTRDTQTDALGLRYGAVGGQIGAEYRVNGNVKLGALFNYSNGEFDLKNGGGRIDQDAYQFGAYASFSYTRWFTDVMAIYSRGDLSIRRAGILDAVRGETSSDSFAIGGRSAYMFDVAPWMQAGPLAGLTYTRSRVGGYTETGDPVLTFAVGGQTVESLTGSAGVQFRFPLMMNGQIISPYVNLTAEHDFKGSGRTILATLTQSPLLPILTPVAGRGGETYGTVQAGLNAAISDRTTIGLNAATTFARSSGNDFGGNVVVKYRF